MRIDLAGKRGHDQLENILTFRLCQTLQSIGIALGEGFFDFIVIFAGQFQGQPVILDFGIPQFIQLGFCLRPRCFAPVHINDIVAVKIHRLLQAVQRVLKALKTAFL